MRTTMWMALLVLAGGLMLAGCDRQAEKAGPAKGAEHQSHEDAAKAAASEATMSTGLHDLVTESTEKPQNEKCPVHNEPVDVNGRTMAYKGKVYGFCCDPCADTFKKDPGRYAQLE